jgi:hypothetical protein
MIALRAVVLGADGFGWIGRLLALVFGRLEALLLSLRAGLFVAPVLRDGGGGCAVLPIGEVVGARAVRLAPRSRSGFARLAVGALVGVAPALRDYDVVPFPDWWGIGFGIVTLGQVALAVRVACFSIGGMAPGHNCDFIVPVC